MKMKNLLWANFINQKQNTKFHPIRRQVA